MRHYIHSEGGYGHVNEDVVQVRSHINDPGVLLCALADGMGGQMGGGVAAEMAVRVGFALADEFDATRLSETATWQTIISDVDTHVSENNGAGFTTLIGLGIIDDMLVGASCGDSAVLILDGRGGQRVLTEEQRKNPPVGSGAALPVSFSARLGSNWQLLVMSDGVWKYLGWEAMIQLGFEHRGMDLMLALRTLAENRCNGRLWDDWSLAILMA